MFSFHSVYGLSLRSNLPIPGLTSLPHATNVDVSVWLGLMPPWLEQALETARVWSVGSYRDEHDNPTRMVWQLEGGNYFRYLYSDGTEFVIERTGAQVWARWPESLTLEDTATYLLGPIFGFLLRLRGFICLHASAVAIGERAIALLGTAGAGKSTTAAAFADSGYPVVSDDVLALIDRGDNFLIQPAYPRLRLWPASVSALYGAADHLPRLTPTWDKRYLDLTENGYKFQQQPLLLAGIYLLDERSDDAGAPLIEKVPARASMLALVVNSYANYVLDREMRSHEFEVFNRLMAHVPFRRVIPHSDIRRLPELCRLLLEDFQSLGGPHAPVDEVGAF